MAYTPVSIGDSVTFHQRASHGSPLIDATATVTAVNGTRVNLEGDGFSASGVENVDFSGEPDAPPTYWANIAAGGGGIELG